MGRGIFATPTASMDWRIVAAINEIHSSYGDMVDVLSKGKALLKFGENDDVDTAWETVWELGGDEVYPTTNSINTISSSAAGDTQVITLEGHTVTGTGSDQQFTFVIQTVTLNGQNKVTLGTPLARVSRAANSNGVALAGDVYVYEDTAIVAGVPSDLTKAHIKISGLTEGYQQSFKTATTFSNTDYFILTGFGVSVAKGNAAAVDFEIQVRNPGGLFRPMVRVSANSAGSTSVIEHFDPYKIIPKNYDIRIRALASTTNVPVNAYFTGYIAQIAG